MNIQDLIPYIPVTLVFLLGFILAYLLSKKTR